MKRFRPLSVMAVLIVFAGCGGTNYDDYRSLLREELSLMNDFNRDAAAAGDAPAMTAALERLDGGLALLAGKMSRWRAEHPDQAAIAVPPPELQAEFDELGKALNALDRALLDKGAFLASPEARAALQAINDRLGEPGF